LPYFTLFLWQFPHFMAIAWMCREDYSRAGYRVLPHWHADRLMFWQILLPSAALIPVTMSQPTVAGAAPVYVAVTGILPSRSSSAAHHWPFAHPKPPHVER